MEKGDAQPLAFSVSHQEPRTRKGTHGDAFCSEDTPGKSSGSDLRETRVNVIQGSVLTSL
jgi:hypothetical protein